MRRRIGEGTAREVGYLPLREEHTCTVEGREICLFLLEGREGKGRVRNRMDFEKIGPPIGMARKGKGQLLSVLQKEKKGKEENREDGRNEGMKRVIVHD